MTEQGAEGVTQGPLPLSKGKRKQPSVPRQPSTAGSQSAGNLRLGPRECRYVGLLSGNPGKTGDTNRRCQPMTMGTSSSCVDASGGQRTMLSQKLPLTNVWVLHALSPSARTWDGIQGQGGPGRRKNPEIDYSCRGV